MKEVLKWIGVGMVTLTGLEIALRLAFPGRLAARHGLPTPTGEETLVVHDANLGWALRPSASTTFINGAQTGSVHTDERGLRQNAATSTVIAGAPNVFMIGDSNTAQLEVNDDETTAARLEAAWRARGTPVNVRNLGVRGYGTDQAVLRAATMQDLQPVHVIYTFTNNDLGDNNALHKPQRQLGKGAFVRRHHAASFSPYNYPVPAYADNALSLVMLDPGCNAVVYERAVPPEELAPAAFSPMPWIKEYSWTARAISLMRSRPWWEQTARDVSIKHLGAYKGWGWMDDVYEAFYEKGPVRTRCAGYLEAQMRTLLARVRKMPSVRSVFVVHYPDAQILPDLAAGRSSPTVEMFERWQAEGFIDGYVNLGQQLVEQKIQYRTFACTGDDWHFCANGTAWMAAEIDKAFGRRIGYQ